VILPGLAELYVLTDDRDDVGTVADLANDVVRDQPHEDASLPASSAQFSKYVATMEGVNSCTNDDAGRQ
jgi:hypothetical protein